MSEANKTRQKLVDSVHKTKAAGGNKAVSGESESGAGEADRPKQRPTKKTTTRARSSTARTKVQRIDPYRSQRRVWPD